MHRIYCLNIICMTHTCENHQAYWGTGEEYPEGQGHIGDEYIQYRISHNRDMRDRNIRDYTPFHTQSDTETKLEDREHIISDIEAKIEMSMGDR
jgi:hypothetical protein